MKNRDEWDSYMVVNILTNSWLMIHGDIEAVRRVEKMESDVFKVIPVRIKRRRWLKNERRS